MRVEEGVVRYEYEPRPATSEDTDVNNAAAPPHLRVRVTTADCA